MAIAVPWNAPDLVSALLADYREAFIRGRCAEMYAFARLEAWQQSMNRLAFGVNMANGRPRIYADCDAHG